MQQDDSATNLQFYPTPPALAKRAWAMFKERHFSRLLEPSAGRGDLLLPDDLNSYVLNRLDRVDCIEIDGNNAAVLKSKGFAVVDSDFLRFEGHASYSHVLLNPPFAQGAEHVLKAFDMVNGAEIVAIVNAQTLKNPYSESRRRLARIVEEFGRVEYVQDAFTDPDTLRKTDIEVALIHLEKPYAAGSLYGHLKSEVEKLRNDYATLSRPSAVTDTLGQQIALPESTIEAMVKDFRAAVRAMEDAREALRLRRYYVGRVGSRLASGIGRHKLDEMFTGDKTEFNTMYDELKRAAWQAVFNATEFTKHLSHGVEKDIEKEIDWIAKKEFTSSNIYGLLTGLVAKKADVQLAMMQEVFDAFGAHHSENTLWYKKWRWKSNDEHRKNAFKLKAKRLIIPGYTEDWCRNINYDVARQLRDFDRAFALLDSNASEFFGLADLFTSRFDELKSAQRFSTLYFDVRYYKKKSSIHLFPTRPDLVERLNRIVGRSRQWLPEEYETVPDAFWVQYDAAESLAPSIEKQISALRGWSTHYQLVQGERDIAPMVDRACEEQGLPIWDQIAQAPTEAGPPPALTHGVGSCEDTEAAA